MVLWILFEDSDKCLDDKHGYLQNENEDPFHVCFLSVMRVAALVIEM